MFKPFPAVKPYRSISVHLRSTAVLLSLAVSLVLPPVMTASGQQLVVEDGVFTQNGERYRGIGVNYYDAFLRNLRDADDTSYDAGFADLADNNIPFARFNAGGFRTNDWNLYRDDPTEYFRRMDAVVASAASHGVQLVPTLFWRHEFIAEFNGEDHGAWNDPDSATRAFARQYATDFVTRYRDNDTILMWEFANEYNLFQDLPTGGSTGRLPEDQITSDGLRGALVEFGELVRDLDPDRAITSGHSVTRAQAAQLREDNTFVRDTVEEFRRITIDDHPEPIDTISVHAYHHGLIGVNNDEQQAATRRFDPDFTADYGDVAQELAAISRDTGKPIFYGEFGVRDSFDFDIPGDGKSIEETTTEDRLRYLLDELTAADAELAAIWAYDRSLGGPADWNIYPSDELPADFDLLSEEEQEAINTAIARRSHLAIIAEYNARWIAAIPEPTTGVMMLGSTLLVLRRR